VQFEPLKVRVGLEASHRLHLVLTQQEMPEIRQLGARKAPLDGVARQVNQL